jgi:hypothetical protein
MATVYISYNHRDRDFVAEIAEHLKSQGHLLTLDVEALCSTLCVQRTRVKHRRALPALCTHSSDVGN